jgi:hypothetical protein
MRYRGGMADEPLPLATYARALAHLISHRDLPIEKVLGALGLTMAQLHAADAHYNDQLGVAFRRRKGVLAMQFAQAFAEARRERGLFGAPPAPPPAPPPAAAESQALPSYLSATPAAVAPRPAAPPGFGAGPPPPPVSNKLPQGTADLSPQPVAAAVVPFQPAAAAPPVSKPAPSAAPVSQPVPSAPPAPGTGTVLAPADGPRSAEAPWDRSQVRERVGKLTLAHFAALTIEMGRNPADPTAVLRRYGLSSTDDLRHVQAAFHAQMSVDPAMRSQFDALLAHMRTMSGRS